jgi:serine/threonine protein kinase
LIHRDVSYNNILLLDPEDRNSGEFRSGLLIDFEYATSQSKSRALAPGSRTVRIVFLTISHSHLSISQGTAPFMAIQLLMKKSKMRHASHHDLESLFFVLIYICTNLSGPGTIRTREELQLHSSIPVSAWFKTSYSLRQVGIAKAGAFCQFEDNILKPFAPYFEDLKPCILKLFNEIYTDTPGIPRPVSHDKMIEIFTETLDTLPHETISNPNFQPLLVTSSSLVRKLSLGIHDKALGPIHKRKKNSSRDAKASHATNSNWTVISGNNANATASGEESARTRGSGSRKSRSGRSLSRPY